MQAHKTSFLACRSCVRMGPAVQKSNRHDSLIQLSRIHMTPDNTTPHTVSRRTFMALSATLPFALKARAASSLPVGLELYSVRKELQRDPQATVRAVAKMGYQCVEFYAPYFEWSEAETKQMRKLLDDLGIRCFSTHNNHSYMTADNLARARDKNLILGCKYMVMASAGKEPDRPDAWKTVGGAEYYLIEQEGSRFSELETAERCLQTFRTIHPR